MLAQFPIDLSKVSKENLDKEILRLGMIAELDAVNLYEQLAEATDNQNMKEVLLDIAKEEKVHIAEFKTMLDKMDKEQAEMDKKGTDEVGEMLKE
jgi:rubrerythrin